jgi:hypothetical protein
MVSTYQIGEYTENNKENPQPIKEGGLLLRNDTNLTTCYQTKYFIFF